MKLDKTILDKMQRIYSLRQNESLRRVRAREAALREQFPRLHEIRQRVATIYTEQMRARICGEVSDARAEELAALRMEEEAILEKAGLEPDYERHLYQCPDCMDTGRLRDGRDCRCRTSVFRQAIYEATAFSHLLERQNFERFRYDFYDDRESSVQTANGWITPRQNMENIVRRLMSYVAEYRTTEQFNLFIMGEVGVGKTYLVSALANLFIDRGIYVSYISAVRMRQVLGDFNGPDNYPDEWHDMHEAEILIIDDLGVEMHQVHSLSCFQELIDKRINAHRPTVFTTNLSWDNIRDRYSERFSSRLHGTARFYRIYGRDLRVETGQ
ncbi:MAG: ATP-binding protein [Eubacteriales bacterium]|nr:ATP-binding protein [Eubacteriales bacterium]